MKTILACALLASIFMQQTTYAMNAGEIKDPLKTMHVSLTAPQLVVLSWFGNTDNTSEFVAEPQEVENFTQLSVELDLSTEEQTNFLDGFKKAAESKEKVKIVCTNQNRKLVAHISPYFNEANACSEYIVKFEK